MRTAAMRPDNLRSPKYFHLSFNLFSRQALIISIVIQFIFGSLPPTNSGTISSRYISVLSYFSSKFIRPEQTTGNYYYNAVLFAVSTNRFYTFSSNSSINTFGYLYNNTFNASNPSENLMMSNDDGADNGQFLLNAYLRYGFTYVLVVTTYLEGIQGNRLGIEIGRTWLNLNLIIDNNTVSSSTKSITVAAAYSGYSGSLALNDTTFIRPNGDWALYYYKAIQVSVFASGSYTLSGSSIIGINGILYNNSFNRANPTRNIISSDDNPNGNNQFTITTWLRPADTYILVVTSYRSYEQGSFVIAADGPARPSFNLLTATRATYSVSLSRSHTKFARPNGNGPNYFYEAIKISILRNGTYTFYSSSNIDTYGILYGNTFNPLHPSQNMLNTDDDTNGGSQFRVTAYLQSALTYILVVTTWSQDETGNFSIVADGPQQPTLSLFPTITTSYYGYLSMSSPVFTRPNRYSSDYYYQAIEVIASETGTYSFSSNSSLDMYGCLYDDSFDPSYPDNSLVTDDDSGYGRQFLISYNLQSFRTYILVVTTSPVSTTGSYLIRANGPAQLILFSSIRTTNSPRRTSNSWNYPSSSDDKTRKIVMIVGCAIAGIGLCAVLIAICRYLLNRKATANRVFIPSVPDQDFRAQNAPIRNLYPSIPEENRTVAPYASPTPVIYPAYPESYPPSYETYTAFLAQSNQRNFAKY